MGEFTSALVTAAGNGDIAIEAFELYLEAVLENIEGGGGDILSAHVLESINNCLLSGGKATIFLKCYLKEHMEMRKATPEDDPTIEDKKAEIKVLEDYLEQLVLKQEPATPARSSAGAAGDGTPDSLPDDATPVEKAIYRNMKVGFSKVNMEMKAGFEGCEERDEKATQQHAITHHMLDEDRTLRQKQALEALMAAQTQKEEREDAELKAEIAELKAKREAARAALEEKRKQAAEDEKAREADRAFLTSQLNSQAMTARSFVRGEMKAQLGNKESELNHEYHAGQMAEAEAQRKAQTLKKMPSVGKGIAAKAKALQLSANENAGQEVPSLLSQSTTAQSITTAPVLSAPRRSARGLAAKQP